MNGIWQNLYPQFVLHFHGFEVDKESTEVFSHLVTLRKKLELHLQEDGFIDLLAVQNAAAAAAKSLQSCPTLCDPVPGILQARTREWVAISFSRA